MSETEVGPNPVYGLQYSDKTSLSSGVVFGLKEDTKLKGNEFANLTSFFCAWGETR